MVPVCLSVCAQDISNVVDEILIFLGGVSLGTRNKRLDFGTDLDLDLNQGSIIFLHFFNIAR